MTVGSESAGTLMKRQAVRLGEREPSFGEVFDSLSNGFVKQTSTDQPQPTHVQCAQRTFDHSDVHRPKARGLDDFGPLQITRVAQPFCVSPSRNLLRGTSEHVQEQRSFLICVIPHAAMLARSCGTRPQR